jgi:hypothetical protein
LNISNLKVWNTRSKTFPPEKCKRLDNFYSRKLSKSNLASYPSGRNIW